MQNFGQIRTAVPHDKDKGQAKQSSEKKKKKTYPVTVAYFTYEIDERLRYVASQFG